MDPITEAVRSIQRNSEQVLQTLIPAKVNPNATVPTIKLNSLTRKNVPLICVAAASGSLEIVKFLVKVGATADAMQNIFFIFLRWSFFIC